MKPINNWENVKAAGSIETLPAGAYVCDIKQAVEKQNKVAGTHLEISFEVCEGAYKDFFGNDYRNQTREDKFWRGVIRQNVPNESSPKYEMQSRFFKAFIECVESSNPGYHWDWNEAGLKGKKIGVVFGEREKQSQTGNIYVVTDAVEVIDVADARNGKFKMPEKKVVQPTANAFGGFAAMPSNSDELPF